MLEGAILGLLAGMKPTLTIGTSIITLLFREDPDG